MHWYVCRSQLSHLLRNGWNIFFQIDHIWYILFAWLTFKLYFSYIVVFYAIFYDCTCSKTKYERHLDVHSSRLTLKITRSLGSWISNVARI